MQVVHGNMFIPLKPNSNAALNSKNYSAPVTEGAQTFSDILAEKSAQGLQFSKHAEQRLKSREIELSGEQMERAAQGANRAKAKGIRDSLVLVDDVALVVNTKSNVVITALESGSDSIFTNIDGAVIV